MFWSHFADHTINQANLNGSNPTIIVTNVTYTGESFFQARNSTITVGLAVDWINDNVYFSYYGYQGSTNMAVYDITTGEYPEIVTSSSYSIYSIAVDPFNQLV